jgi:hypothetical protein
LVLGSRLFGLRSSIFFSLVAKLSFFAIGIVIMGVSASRSVLPSCQSTTSPSLGVYSAPYGSLEAYTDYRDLYMRCLVTPFLDGRPAYNLPIVYNYPPLFLYTLSVFGLVKLVWFPAIPLVVFDALTVIPIYLIGKQFLFSGSDKKAFAISLIWIFNPLNLLYNDLMWLNPGPTTFFMMMSILLFLRKNWLFSSIFLAISTGFKQTAVLIFPVLLIALWRMKGFSKSLFGFFGLYIGLLVVISTPYIFQNPQSYLWSLQLPLLGNPPGVSSGYPTTFVYDLSQPTRLTTFLGLVKFVNLQDMAVSSYLYLNDIFLLIFAAVVLWLVRTNLKFERKPTTHWYRAINLRVHLKRNTMNESDILVYSLVFFLLFFSLFGRGVYKYYFASLTPLGLLIFSSRRAALVFEAFSISLLLLPREVTPWFAILLLTLIPTLGIQSGGAAEAGQGLPPPPQPSEAPTSETPAPVSRLADFESFYPFRWSNFSKRFKSIRKFF